MLGNAISKLLLPICIIAAVAYWGLGPRSLRPSAEHAAPRLDLRAHHGRHPVRHRAQAVKPSSSASDSAAPKIDPVAGMVVARDPETGELGLPSPEQMRAIGRRHAEITRNTPEGFTEIRRADGSVGVLLNGKIQSYSIARVGPDGKPTTQCLTADSDSAALALPAPRLEDR